MLSLKMELIHYMEYYLCIATSNKDKSLMHIVQKKYMHQPFYASYKVVAKVRDEESAYATVCSYVQNFCNTFGDKDFSGFRAWLAQESTKGALS